MDIIGLACFQKNIRKKIKKDGWSSFSYHFSSLLLLLTIIIILCRRQKENNLLFLVISPVDSTYFSQKIWEGVYSSSSLPCVYINLSTVKNVTKAALCYDNKHHSKTQTQTIICEILSYVNKKRRYNFVEKLDWDDVGIKYEISGRASFYSPKGQNWGQEGTIAKITDHHFYHYTLSKTNTLHFTNSFVV